MKLKDYIRSRLEDFLSFSPFRFVIGLGLVDENAIFGTSSGLQKKFPGQVIEPITGENGFTGLAFGLAITGSQVVLTHQRFDFALLSFDQIVNSISKIYYMSGGAYNCPVFVRVIVGRGWGQGPTHAQNFSPMLACIPGLAIVSPAFPSDYARAFNDFQRFERPTICIEHRWALENDEDITLKELESLAQCSASTDYRGRFLVDDSASLLILCTSKHAADVLIAVEFLKSKGVSCDVYLICRLDEFDDVAVMKWINYRTVVLFDDWYAKYGLTAEISRQLLMRKYSGRFENYELPFSHIPAGADLVIEFELDSLIVVDFLVERGLIDLDQALSISEKASLKRKNIDQLDSRFTGPF